MPILDDKYIHKVIKGGAKSLTEYKKGVTVNGNTTMHPTNKSYKYTLDASPGEMPPEFRPYLTPGDMLALGAFEGKYLNDCWKEFPVEWYLYAASLGKLSSTADASINYFKIKSRQPLSVWKENGWAPTTSKPKKKSILSDPETNPDERGWFQWYCRYWLGRRIPELDKVQIARWKAFNRHAGQIRAHCTPGDLSCRPKQRQALLQWAYNPFI
jgi:hypothetical protein